LNQAPVQASTTAAGIEPMKISYRVLGNAFTLVVLFLSTGAFLSLVVGTGIQATSEGSPLTQAMWAVVFLIVALIAISMRRQIAPLVRANKCLCLFVLFTIVSAVWSQDRFGTLRQGLALLGTTLFGVEIAVRYTIRQQVRLACIVLGSVIVLSIATQIFFPGLIPQEVGSDPSVWQGAFGQKNTLGRIVVLGAAAFLCRPRRSRRDTVILIGLMLVAGAVVVAAHSASSLVELVAIVLISRALAGLRWRPSRLMIAVSLSLVIALPAVYLALNNVDRVTAVLGRDATLTGRTDLWRFVARSIASRPILGYGYGVFWQFSSEGAARIRGAIGWDAPSAHDGYMDLLLDVGVIGLLLYVVAFVVAARRAVILYRSGPPNNMMWPLLVLTEILLCQITEASIVSPHSTYWILYVAVAFSVSKPPVDLPRRMPDINLVESLPEPVLTEV
jgi:exopolysaccharide production protein ExoQ